MAGRKRKSSQESFTPEIDKRIIEGFVGEEKAMFDELAKIGLNRDAILKRATYLGLSKQFIALCKKRGTKVSVRRCLSCDEPFLSLGPQIRLCQRCKSKKS